MRSFTLLAALLLAACTPPRYAHIEPQAVSPVEGQNYKVRVAQGEDGTLEAWSCWSQGLLQWRKWESDSRREAVAATLEVVGSQCPGAAVAEVHHDGTEGREHCYEIILTCDG